MDTAVYRADSPTAWTIVCDDNCPVVRFLARAVKWLDRRQFFSFVGPADTDPRVQPLIRELERSPWSLLLIDDNEMRWQGPDAIPFILKNLPSGRLFVVAYLLPGTMWLTRSLYQLVSRHRRKLSTALEQKPAKRRLWGSSVFPFF